jgi:hypothetical protein
MSSATKITMGRQKLDRERTNPYKVSRGTTDRLESLAIKLGYRYGSGAAMGKFLEMISNLNPDLLTIISERSIPKKEEKAGLKSE